MKTFDSPGTQSSFIGETVFGLRKALPSPHSTFSWILRGHMLEEASAFGGHHEAYAGENGARNRHIRWKHGAATGSNIEAEGTVVTVDLPLDFDMAKQGSLTYPEGELNLTPHGEVGRQYQGHWLSNRIKQGCGDSGELNCDELGGPFDLVFIDGCHTEAYVRSDSENAVKHLAVSSVGDGFAREIRTMDVYALDDTRLAFGVKREDRAGRQEGKSVDTF